MSLFKGRTPNTDSVFKKKKKRIKIYIFPVGFSCIFNQGNGCSLPPSPRPLLLGSKWHHHCILYLTFSFSCTLRVRRKMTRASVENCVKDEKRWRLVFGGFLSLMFTLSVEEKEFSVSHRHNCELSPQKTWSLTSFTIKHLEACNFLAKRRTVWGNVYIAVYLEWNGNRVYTKCIGLVFTPSSTVGLFESLPIWVIFVRAWARSQTSTFFFFEEIKYVSGIAASCNSFVFCFMYIYFENQAPSKLWMKWSFFFSFVFRPLHLSFCLLHPHFFF